MRTESDLREALRGLAGDPVDPDEMLAKLITGRDAPDVAPRAARRWRLPALAGVVAASLIIGGVALYRSVDQQTARVPAAAAPGTREVSFYGVAIDVPADWGTNEEHCGTAIENTVLLEGSVADCGVANPPLVSSVSLHPYDDHSTPSVNGLTNTTVQISGVTAQKFTQTSGSFHITMFRVPKVKAEFDVTSPDATLGDRIGATLHAVSEDTNGCQSEAPDATHLIAGERASRTGSDQALIPPGATRLVVCSYQATLLENGTTVRGADVASFISTIDAIPEGFSRAPSGNHIPEVCKSSPSARGSTLGIEASDSEIYLVIAHYASGPSVTVTAKLGQCGDLGAANGTRSAQRTPALIKLITSTGVISTQFFSDDVTGP